MYEIGDFTERNKRNGTESGTLLEKEDNHLQEIPWVLFMSFPFLSAFAPFNWWPYVSLFLHWEFILSPQFNGRTLPPLPSFLTSNLMHDPLPLLPLLTSISFKLQLRKLVILLWVNPTIWSNTINIVIHILSEVNKISRVLLSSG